MLHANYFILGKIIEALNAPEGISSYACKKRKLRLLDQVMNYQLINFLVLTVGFIVVRRDDDEHFVKYSYNESKSKLLYSFFTSVEYLTLLAE